MPVIDRPDVYHALSTLKLLMPHDQHDTVRGQLNDEDGPVLAKRLMQIATRFADLPGIGEQRSLGVESVVHLHYYWRDNDWYVMEKDRDGPGDEQVYGLSVLARQRERSELGYFSLAELIADGAELDLPWEPRPLSAVLAKLA